MENKLVWKKDEWIGLYLQVSSNLRLQVDRYYDSWAGWLFSYDDESFVRIFDDCNTLAEAKEKALKIAKVINE